MLFNGGAGGMLRIFLHLKTVCEGKVLLTYISNVMINIFLVGFERPDTICPEDVRFQHGLSAHRKVNTDTPLSLKQGRRAGTAVFE